MSRHARACRSMPALAILSRSVIHSSAVHLADLQRPVFDLVF
jgi:hypothetical protein